MVDILIKALWFLLAICILVPVHEFGHFYAMRLFGVRVLRFSVGFGQRLCTWTDAKGTEFALSAIPLGGYVKPLDERSEDVAPEDMPYTLNSKPEWQRIIIFAAGPLANFILAIVFYWVILFVVGTQSYSPIIGDVAPESPAARAGLSSGQEIIAVDGEPTPTRKAVALQLLKRLGESGNLHFTTRYPDSTLVYESDVEITHWLDDQKDPNPFKSIGLAFYYPPLEPIIDQVLAGSAAERAGFKTGDRLIAMDGLTIEGWEEWVHYVRERPSQPIEAAVARDGDELVLTLTPEALTRENGEVLGRAGVSVELPKLPPEMVRRHHYNPVNAVGAALQETWDTGVFILLSMKKLIFGEISSKNLSGPIGIAKVAASHAEQGAWAFISFLAHLSIVLGVMNLLPIPMLDGGHIVFALVEWVKGSPVSQEIQAWSLNAGIMLLVGVMMIAFYNDILGA